MVFALRDLQRCLLALSRPLMDDWGSVWSGILQVSPLLARINSSLFDFLFNDTCVWALTCHRVPSVERCHHQRYIMVDCRHLGAAIGISSPFFYAMKVRVRGGVAHWIEDWAPAFDPKRAQAIYAVLTFVLMYAFPLVVIAMFHFAIAVKVWRRRTPGHTSSAKRQVLKESKKNVLKMSTAIVLAFAFCWFLMHLIAMFLRLVASLYGFKPQVFYVVTPTAPSTTAYTRGYLVKNTGKVLNKIWNLFCRDFSHLQHEQMGMKGRRIPLCKQDKIDDRFETLSCLNKDKQIYLYGAVAYRNF